MLRRQTNGSISYTEILAIFEARFGTGSSDGTRKKWQEVSLNHPGKLSVAQFREFGVNFRHNAMDVKDITPPEMRRVLMSKLPEIVLKWVVEHEYKFTRERPVVQMTTTPGMTESECRESLAKICGELPLKVVCKGNGVYQAQFHGEAPTRVLLRHHGEPLPRGGGRVQVRMLEKLLSADDIFEFVEQRLSIREKADAFQSIRRENNPRLPRSVREAQILGKEKIVRISTENSEGEDELGDGKFSDEGKHSDAHESPKKSKLSNAHTEKKRPHTPPTPPSGNKHQSVSPANANGGNTGESGNANAQNGNWKQGNSQPYYSNQNWGNNSQGWKGGGWQNSQQNYYNPGKSGNKGGKGKGNNQWQSGSGYSAGGRGGYYSQGPWNPTSSAPYANHGKGESSYHSSNYKGGKSGNGGKGAQGKGKGENGNGAEVPKPQDK